MMPDASVLLASLLAWAIQSLVIAGTAALVLRALPATSAEFRYAAWRTALLACVAVPWLPAVSWRARADMAVDVTPLAAVFEPFTTTSTAIAPATISWLPLAWGAIVVVALGRAMWLAAGIVRLARLRRTSIVVETEEFADVQRGLATRAEIRYASDLKQPVTFGLRRPVILLPVSLADAPETLRRAVTTHELMHVRRRDWGWLLAEEALRTICWYNPAVWFLTSRIQRGREEVVDHLTVLAIGSRRDYIEALLAFADTNSPSPAPAFARRAHLFTRITRISKESAMSSVRVVLSGLVILASVVVAMAYAGATFPVAALAAAPPIAAEGVPAPPARWVAAALTRQAPTDAVRPVTPDNPIPRRVSSVPVQHPIGQEDLAGIVQVVVRVDQNGVPAVREMRSVATSRGSGASRPEATGTEAANAFYRAAADAIGQWRYEPPVEAPIEFIVAVQFPRDGSPIVRQFESARGLQRGMFIGSSPPPPPPPPPPAPPLAPASVPPFAPAVAPPPPPPPPPAPAEWQALRIGSEMKRPIRTRDARPVYPPEAMAAKVQGVVSMDLLIDADGRVAETKVLRSIPELDDAAIDAARQWEFTPTLLNGVAVPVIVTAQIQFTLR